MNLGYHQCSGLILVPLDIHFPSLILIPEIRPKIILFFYSVVCKKYPRILIIDTSAIRYDNT